MNGEMRCLVERAVKVGTLLIMMAGLASCRTGAYRLDMFPEMHYQQSYRSQEPPQVDAASEAVPITGREVVVDLAEAAALTNPVAPGPAATERGPAVFRANCAPCHGATGNGSSAVAGHFKAASLTPPADLASAPVLSLSDGQLFWFISYGREKMPPFRLLLSPEDRWALVHFIRSLK